MGETPAAVGIDFDTNDLYLCLYQGNDITPLLCAVRLRARDADIVQSIQAIPLALATARRVLGIDDRHAAAWVEQGTGQHRTADWKLGAIAGGIIASWRGSPGGGPVYTIRTDVWKKHIGAPGNAKKIIANQYATLQWRSRHNGTPPPTDPNLLDAYAIALAAYSR